MRTKVVLTKLQTGKLFKLAKTNIYTSMLLVEGFLKQFMTFKLIFSVHALEYIYLTFISNR